MQCGLVTYLQWKNKAVFICGFAAHIANIKC